MNNLSIYVHWPFCLSKCPYCDFNSHIATIVDDEIWLKSYERELEHFAEIIKNKYIKSIFFGGGTPSLMNPKIVAGVINKIAKLGMIDDKTEITLEANPTSFEIEKFKAFKQAGVNRVSIGVQSLRNEDLQKLGRKHDTSQAIMAIKSANEIFSKVSFDLIYARSGQTLKDWQTELKEALNLASGHISLYQLTIEKGTSFYKLFHDGDLALPTNDIAADMYEWTTSYLKSKGYNRYEISNYATSGNECLHNLTYWNYNDYLGIGPGAHSRIRTDSVSSIMMWHRPEKWLKSVDELGQGIQTYSKLSSKEVIDEVFMMGLRLKTGIKNDNFKKLTGFNIKDLINHKTASEYVNLELLVLSDNTIYLTDKGLSLHSYLVPRLI